MFFVSLLVGSCILTASFLNVNGLKSINIANISNSIGVNSPTAVRVGPYPIEATYDSLNHFVYISSYASNTVTVLEGKNVIAKIAMPIFSAIEGIVYDPSDNYIYVADSNTDSISIISNVTLLTTFSLYNGVASAPQALAYDPGCVVSSNVSDGCVIVANYFGNTLYFIQYCHSSTCIGGSYISGFDEPNSIAYVDPYNTVIVSNNGNFTLTSIERGVTNSLVCETTQMNAPTDIAYDPVNGYIYVTTSGFYSTSPNYRIYVLNPYSFCYGKGVVTYIPVNSPPLATAYDPNNQDMYVTLRNGSYIAINAANLVVGKGVAGSYPISMVFNEFTNRMYIIDFTKSGSVTIVS